MKLSYPSAMFPQNRKAACLSWMYLSLNTLDGSTSLISESALSKTPTSIFAVDRN